MSDKIWYIKGIKAESENDFENAIYCFDKAIEINPNNALPYQHKGSSLLKLDRLEEAEKILVTSTEKDPYDSKTWYELGYAQNTLGKFVEAGKSYRKAIETDPTIDKSQ